MSRTHKKELQIRVVGQRRKEPDVRRIAKAIIRLSLDADEATDRLLELDQQQRTVVRRRRAAGAEPGEKAAS